MKFRKKSDSSINDSTNSSPTNPDLDSPAIPENDNDLLSPNPELATDKSKKKKKGFPVFGCLSIFLGLGILGGIALPTFLNAANKSNQFEARTYVGTMNRAQQAYLLENKAFTNSFDDLGLGIATQTENYQYSIRATKTAAFNYGVVRHNYEDEDEKVEFGPFQYNYVDEKVEFGPFQWTTRKNTRRKSYVGGVFLLPATTVDSSSEINSVAILCLSVTPGTAKPAEPILKNGVPTCGTGTKKIGGR